MEEYIVLSIIIIVLLLLVLLFYRSNLNLQKILDEKNTNSNLELDKFMYSLSKEISAFQNEIVSNFKDDLNVLNQNTLTNLHNVTLSMNEGLNLNQQKTSESFLEMSKQLISVEKTQESLNELSNDIISLQNILGDKKSRGLFGEIELYSILKSAYGLNDKAYQKQYKLSNNTIADAVLFAPAPLNKIVIDSKFPLENYLRMYDDTLNKVAQDRASVQFKRDIKKHIDDIKNKYIIKGESAPMAFLFIPAEAIFAEIYGKHNDVVLYSYDSNVYLVSPTTLMAYISAIKAIYLNVQQNERVDEIISEFSKLAIEFERFNDRYQIVVKDFMKTQEDMRQVTISANKIINRFYEIEAVKLEDKDER